jgi:site-specific recombinase XerD
VVPSGKKVVYYYAYDEEGTRKGPWSTGQTSKTAARNVCNLLNRKGTLLPEGKTMPTFEEYAAGFWDWLYSPYLKERRKRVKLTQNYTDKCKNVTDNTLVSYFGKMKLDKITGEVIEGWLDTMIETGKKNVTINGYFGTLMTMMKWAVRKRIIERDPFLDVQRLIKETKEKKIITQDEFKAMFVDDWKKVWDNDLLMCTAHKLAALTSMRCSEVLGLKGEYVFDNYLYLCGQFDDYGYRETKTKINGDGFVFSEDGGETPITRRRVYLGLQRACGNIGISEDDMKKRGINVHAWRHFCNTELLKGGLTVKKVQAVTGHKSEGMTDNYTHFDPMEFLEVSKIQEMLLAPKKDIPKKERPALTLVKCLKAKKAISVK